MAVVPSEGVDRFVTRPFIQLSLAVGLFAGFGLGSAPFVLGALGIPLGQARPALAQAHGHAQLFGFAGLMVLGVALVFLPRLRGAPLAGAGLVPWVLALYGGGVLLRVVTQVAAPFLAPAAQERLLPLAVFGFLAGAALTLAGAIVVVAMLVGTALAGPPLRQRAGLLHVLPLLVTAWLGFLAALVANTAGAFESWRAWALPLQRLPVVGQAPWLIPPAHDALAVRLALLGWLVPMSVAFAARNFPLFLSTPPAPRRALAAGAALLIGGVLLDMGADPRTVVGRLGAALEGTALLWLTGVVGALGPRTPVPGRPRDAREAERAEIAATALTDSFAWLAVAGVLLIAQAGLPLAGIAPPPEDVWRHALGAGFVLLLIVGMALRLIPGFAGGGSEIDLRAARVAVRAAQAAALLRVAPPLAVWLLSAVGPAVDPGAIISWLLGAARISGAVALGALWLALRPALRRPGRAAGSAPG